MLNKERNLTFRAQALTLLESEVKIDDIIKITGFFLINYLYFKDKS